MKVKGFVSAVLTAAMCVLCFCTAHAANLEKYTSPDGTEYKYGYTDDGKIYLQYVSSTIKDIIVPDKINGKPVKVFSGYQGVTKDTVESIVLPETCIGIEYFNGYPALKSVTAEGALDYLVDFDDCENLETVTVKKGVKTIWPHAFRNTPKLKTVGSLDGLVSIGKMAFFRSGIEKIDLPDTLETMDIGAFAETPNLKKISIPASLTTMPPVAFQQSGLEEVEFKGNISIMGSSAFVACENLRTVKGFTKDQLVKYWNAFARTPLRTEMTDDGNPFVMDSSGFLAAYVGTDTEVVIPDTVTEIGNSAFTINTEITKVTIPSSVTKINDSAFYGCDKLTEITIPASVTWIGEGAFSHCRNLKYVTFEPSDKLLSLGSAAFQLAAVTKETFNSNGRRYSNKNTAFALTELDPDYGPADTEATEKPDETEQPEETAQPKETVQPEETEQPKETVQPEETEQPKETPAMTSAPTPAAELTVTSDGADIAVAIDGESVEFTDAKPFIDDNDRTQIPVRAVTEALGAAVDWDEAARRVSVSGNGRNITLTIGSDMMDVNGKDVQMDTAAMIIGGRTYIPLRFVAEAMGMSVDWTAMSKPQQ